MMMNLVRLVIGPLVVTVGLSACATSPDTSTGPEKVAPAADRAITLLTRPASDESDGNSEALIVGRFNVGPGGCVRVDKFLLIAPAGSVATKRHVNIEGVGRFALGSKITTGGAYIYHSDITVPGTDECRNGDTEPQETAEVSGAG